MKTLYFIRHGFALHNQYFKSMGVKAFYDQRCIDAPLIGEGWKQASDLNRTIHTFPIEIALVSPMLRTLQTATEVFRGTTIPLKCVEDLREYPMGTQTCNHRIGIVGRKREFMNIDFSYIDVNPEINYQEREESLEDLNERIDGMKAYISTLPYSHIAIVSHSSLIGQWKDNHIRYIENGDTELKHCHPYISKL